MPLNEAIEVAGKEAEEAVGYSSFEAKGHPHPPSSSNSRQNRNSRDFDAQRRVDSGPVMVLVLDGNSEIGAHVRNNLCNVIC